MKRNKKIGMLLAVFCCICLAAFGVSKYEEQKEIIKNSDEIILRVSEEDVETLSWECDTGSFAFHRDENGGWLYDADEAFPVNEGKLKELLGLFQEFGVSFIIEEVEDFGQYGLDSPVCTIRLATESETYEILVGNYSEMDSERYVSIGDGKAYLVKNDPLDLFAIEISDMIRHDEVPEFEDVEQVRVSGTKQEKIIYEENSDNTYYAEDVYFLEQGDAYLPLDTSRVNEYLNVIKNLGLKDYVAYNAAEDDLAAYGLDNPELSVSIDYMAADKEAEEKTSQTFILSIAQDPAEREEEEKADIENGEDVEVSTAEDEVTAYARVGESKIIYQISSEQYRKLMEISYDSLRHQEMFWADFSDMYQIDITLEDRNYSITSEMEDEQRVYYYNGKEVELAGVRSAIRGIKAKNFADETPAQKEEISFTIYLDNENFPNVQIQLYRYDGNDCIAVVDGKTVAFVERASVVDLVEAVNTIVLE